MRLGFYVKIWDSMFEDLRFGMYDMIWDLPITAAYSTCKKHTKNLQQNQQINRSYECADSVQHTIQHRTIPIIFLLILQTTVHSVAIYWKASRVITKTGTSATDPVKAVATCFLIVNEAHATAVNEPNFAVVHVGTWHVRIQNVSEPSQSASRLVHTREPSCTPAVSVSADV